MKKRKVVLILICAVIAVSASVVMGVNTVKRSPFDKITPDNVKSVEYFIYYFDDGESVWLDVPQERLDEFYTLINNIKITGFGSDYHHNLNGGTNIMFEVVLNDGTVMEFASCNPGMVIADKYYNSEYEQTNALYEFWAELVPQGRAEYGLDEYNLEHYPIW
ncbi:MAG: hypothetical protein IJZ35_07390 [Clostridia bacterium]|nr:hypothetical protein [Clostridia bacterium]